MQVSFVLADGSPATQADLERTVFRGLRTSLIEFERVIGMDHSSIIDTLAEDDLIELPEYGDLTMKDMTTVARETGLRGMDAVHEAAARSSRRRTVRTSAPTARPTTTTKVRRTAQAPRTPRSRRGTTAVSGGRSSPRLGDDPEPEPPLRAPLDAQARDGLRRLISDARRQQVQAAGPWRLCKACDREKEPEEFGAGCTYCRSCETDRVREYQRRREAVAA